MGPNHGPLLEGEIDQRQQNHQTHDREGGGQQHKEYGDRQVTKHLPEFNVPEKVHGVAKQRPRLVRSCAS